MPSTSSALAFVMDPIGSVDIHADTTFALMLEAQRRGHRLACIDPADLGVDAGAVVAKVFPVTLRAEVGNHADLGEPRHVELDAEFDAVFQRKDPPVDEDYLHATWLLAQQKIEGQFLQNRILARPSDVVVTTNPFLAQHLASLWHSKRLLLVQTDTQLAHPVRRLAPRDVRAVPARRRRPCAAIDADLHSGNSLIA